MNSTEIRFEFDGKPSMYRCGFTETDKVSHILEFLQALDYKVTIDDVIYQSFDRIIKLDKKK